MRSLEQSVEHLLMLHYAQLGAKCKTFAEVALCLAWSKVYNICWCYIMGSLKQNVEHLLLLHYAKLEAKCKTFAGVA